MLIPGGGLADRFGRKRIFLCGVAIFLGASLACGLAPSLAFLVGARAMQAVGAALLTPSSLSLVLEAFPSTRRAFVVSLWGAVGALAAATGPGLGSIIVDTMGWPWAFYLNLPIGLWSIWKGSSLLRESDAVDNPRPLDGIGAGLLIVGIGAVTLCIVRSESPDWTRAQLSTTAALGVVALAVFAFWTRWAKAPLIDPVLFRSRTYRYVNFATFVFGVAFAMMFFTFFFYMTRIWHFDLPSAGLAVTPGPLMVIPTAVVVGRLATRHGHRRYLVAGSLVYAASGLWFLLVPGTEPNYASEWLPGLLLSGIGVGMVMPSLSGAAVARLPPAHYAVGSAFNQATRQMGGVIGVALTVLLIGQSTVLSRADFDPVYGLHIALALITALTCTAVD